MLPWKQTNPEREQIDFIERWKGGEVSFVELCGQFGISRKTGYKRVRRFQSYSWEGLGRPEPSSASSSQYDPTHGSRSGDRGQAGPSDLGTEETGGVAARRGARGVSRLESGHGRGHPGPCRAGATSETAPACNTL